MTRVTKSMISAERYGVPIKDFRHDINGLRAYAVAAVVLYHFNVPGFRGGYIGVDIFFAISGFLMTSIIVSGLQRPLGFSVWQFYLARAQRLMPALIVLCSILLMAGWWLLLPGEYKTLGTHVISVVTFLSNIQFWHEIGYFDAASHRKWLLHTWSLSVEWQFYMLLPLALSSVWKLRPGRGAALVVVGAMFLASFAACLLVTMIRPNDAFYLLPTRAWEMLVGGFVYFLAGRMTMTPRRRLFVEAAGFCLIMGAVWLFDAGSNWPGWRAAVPVTGAVLVLIAHRAASFWTNNPVTQWLGTRSYSIYLWHWPLVVVLAYGNWRDSPSAVASGLLLTLLLGHLSYEWIEVPTQRKLKKITTGLAVGSLVCSAAIVAAIGVTVRWQGGFEKRLAPEINSILEGADDINSRRGECHPGTGKSSPSCVYGGALIGAVLVGDSHANALVTALAIARPNTNTGVMEWSYSGCPILIGVRSAVTTETQCADFVDWTVQKLKEMPSDVPIVIVSRHAAYAVGSNDDPNRTNIPWVYFSRRYNFAEPSFLEEYSARIAETACQMAQNHVVYLVRPIPEMGVNVPGIMARVKMLGGDVDVSIPIAEYHRRNEFIWAGQDQARKRCGVRILDPLPYLCSDGRCYGGRNGKPIYSDDNHLNEFGNRLLSPMFTEVFTHSSQQLPKVLAK